MPLRTRKPNHPITMVLLCALLPSSSIAAGEAWTTFAPPIPDFTSLMGVGFNDQGIGVAIEKNGAISRSTDGARRWEILHQFPCAFQAMTFVGQDTVIAVGECDGVYRSVDAGLNWSRVELPVSAAPLYSIAFANSQVGMALGYGGEAVRTTDAGLSWTTMPDIPGAPNRGKLKFPSEQLGILVGEGKILRSTDAGISWTQVNHGIFNYGFTDFAFANADDGVIVDYSSRIFRTTNTGITWRLLEWPQESPSSGNNWSVAFGEDGRGIAFSDWGLLRTIDNGATWSLSGDRREGVVGYQRNVGWFGFSDRYGFGNGSWNRIQWSGDFGENWNTSTVINRIRDLKGLAILSTGRAIAVGDSGAFFDINIPEKNGTPIDARLPAKNLASVAFRDSLAGIAVGGQGVLVTTIDGGQTWEAASGIAAQDLFDVAYSPTGVACAVGSRGLVLRSENGGTEWVSIANGNAGGNLRAIAFVDSMKASAVGDGGRILVSRDGALSWSYVDHNLTEENLRCLAFYQGSKLGWAGGDKGSLLQTQDGGETWAKVAAPAGAQSFLSLAVSKQGLLVAVTPTGISGRLAAGMAWVGLTELAGTSVVRFIDGDRLIAVGTLGRITFSGSIDFSLGRPVLKNVPSNPMAQSRDLELSWTPVTWADAYRVTIARDSGFVEVLLQTEVSGNTLKPQGLDSYQEQFWKVEAKNPLGYGPASAVGRVPALMKPSVVRTSLESDWSQWKSSAEITGMGPRDSLLWMSTKAGLVRIPIRGGAATVFNTSNSQIPFNVLTTLNVFAEEEVMAGGPEGAVVFDEGRWKSYTYQNAPLRSGDGIHTVSGIAQTKNGMLWLATRAITMSLDVNGVVESDLNNLTGGFYYPYFSEGNQGSVFAFDGKQWTTAFEGNVTYKLSIETVLGLVSDPDGDTWWATRAIYRGAGSSVSIYKGNSQDLGTERKYNFTQNGQSTPWLTGLQATDQGLWASAYGGFTDSPTSTYRAIVFIPKQNGNLSIIVPLSTSGTDYSVDRARFGHPATVFSLDSKGNPWVLARDSLFEFERDGTLFGIEILPPGLAARGPFREMKIDKQGILFLRNDSTVFWKVKATPTAVNPAVPGKAGLSLTHGRKGLQLNLPSAAPLRIEYLNLQGRSVHRFDLGLKPAGIVDLPAFPESGSALLKVEAGAERKYFMVGPR